MLINIYESFLNARTALLAGLILTVIKAGNLPTEEVRWQKDEECRLRDGGTNPKNPETDVTWGHRTHLTEPMKLGETAEIWGRHKLTRKGTRTRKKWNNYSDTKRTVTTMHILTEQYRFNRETELRKDERSKGTQTETPENLRHPTKKGINPQEKRGGHTTTTRENNEAEVPKTPLRQKYRTGEEEGNTKRGTHTQPLETLTHLVGGAKVKRNIWGTTEVYGVALSGKEGTTQEYLWEEQILAALYLADRTQPPIQYPQPHEKFIEIMEDIGDINMERRDRTSHRRAGLGAAHLMRQARNEGGRQMYVVNSHLHWKLVMMDSTKKQVWAFDPMGNKFNGREEDVITRAFPEHTFQNLDVKVQGREDHVNCGVWVIWAGRTLQNNPPVPTVSNRFQQLFQ